MKKIRLVALLGAVLAQTPFIANAEPLWGGTGIYGTDCWPKKQSDESQGGENGDAGPTSANGKKSSLSDPVYLPHGDFLEKHTDIYLPGRGLSIEFIRSHRARTGLHGLGNQTLDFQASLGLGWSHNYDQWVEVTTGQAMIYSGNERRIIMLPDTSWNGSGSRYTKDNYHGVLDAPGSSESVKYITDDNTVYKYHPVDLSSNIAGRLESITDRNGNTISLSYGNGTGLFREQLLSVTDGLGNSLSFTYYDDPSAPRPVATSNTAPYADLLWKVTDHTNRVVEYLYDFSTELGTDPDVLLIRELKEVILPPIDESSGVFDLPAEHRRFSQGRSIQYEYYRDNGTFNGLITKITNENGVDILENFYEDPGGEQQNGSNTRRLYKQVYAGGTYTHTLTDDEGSAANPTTGSDFSVWVQKRDGRVVRLDYSGSLFSVGFVLQSRTDYPGVVPSAVRGKMVWLDSSGESAPQWHYADSPTSAAEDFSGPINQLRPNDIAVTTGFEFNDDWNQTRLEQPNGDVVEYIYNEDADDARSRGALTSTITKPAGTVVNSDGIPFSTHPDWITTTYEHNFSFWPGVLGGCGCGSDQFATAIIDGKGNRTEKEYWTSFDFPITPPTGNLKAIYHDIPPGGTRANAAAVEEFVYITGGNLETHTHPETTRLVNGVPESYRRVDEFVYYSDTHPNISSRGKVQIQRIDKNGESLETQYEYDAIGNVSKITDPRGDVSTYLYNQGRQLVREQHWNTDETTLFAQTDYFYDANGNLTIEKITSLDENQNAISTNPLITTVYEYNDLDLLTKRSVERGDVQTETIVESSGALRATAPMGSDWVTQVWAYDENDNLIRFEDGDSVANSGASFNVIEYEYDFRDLIYRQTQGAGSSNELVTQYDYDKNKRLVNRTTNPDSISGMHQTELFFYDGFNRLIGMTDPMLNTATFTYDDNHNQLSVQICGPNDEDTQGADTDLVLYLEQTEYDTRDRVIEKKVSVFDFLNGAPSDCTSLPGGTQVQSTLYTYNDDSSLRQVDAPTSQAFVLNTTEYFYDTVGRLAYIEDGADNAVEYQYDLDSNVIRLDQYDLSSSGIGSQRFISTYSYDNLDRQVSSVDGALNSIQWRYDSRSNVVSEINAKGNLTTYDYDGLSRLIATRVRMTADGDGPENDPALATNGEILISIVYDDSSRVIAETDDNGNTTTYAYDAVNRRTSITMPVTSETYLTEYNGNGVASKLTDARGVVLDLTYDQNNRLTRREVNAGGTVPAGSQFEDLTYDGLGRITTATNLLTKVIREYDSRSFVVRETQNADGANGFEPAMDRVVNYEFDIANNTTRILYPHGRDIQRSYDSINRLVSIKDYEPATPMAITDFDYIGQRLERRINGNGTETAYAYNGFELFPTDPNDKGFGRVIGITTTDSSSSAVLDGFAFTWDANQSRTSYKDVGSGMKNRRERVFGYDSSDRLVSTDVDFPDPLTDFTSPTNNGITDYDLDGVHNRFSVTGFEEAGAPIGIYKDASVDMPDHISNNQYTFSPREGGGEWTYLYDDNGNMILKAQYNVADFSGDYELNFLDYSAFLTAYGNEESSADLNGDGAWDFFDLTAFLTAYGQGGSLNNQHFTYDFRSQLIGIESFDGSDPDPLFTVTNTYDPFARRVIEAADEGDGSGVIQKQMVYGCDSLWEVIEQIQLAEGASPEKLLTSHVYGLGIDDEVSYRLEDLVNTEDFWAHRDDLNSLTSVTDINGDVKERYEYGDFGQVTIFDPVTGIERTSDEFIGATHLYTGRSLITGTGLADFRSRVLDLETGKFIQRDPLGYIDSMNAYAYVINNPYTFTDPYGLSYWRKVVDGWNTVVDTLDGTLQEEANEQANDLTDMANKNYKKARDRGDPCAEAMRKRLLDDAAAVMANATGLADQTKDGIQAVTIAVASALPAGAASKVVKGFRSGKEYRITKNLRVAPYGNRVNPNWAEGSKAFQRPHYHRKIVDKTTGATKPGGGMKWHRPWESGW